MTIDIKKLQTAIVAEVNRREYERVSADVNSVKPSAAPPQDIVRAFELIEIESYLPPPQPKKAKPAQASPPAPEPAVDSRPADTSLRGRILGHPRLQGFMQRAQQRPGGATPKNILIMLIRAVVLRIPYVQRAAHFALRLRHVPWRVEALEHHVTDEGIRLRQLGLQIQNQTNQSLYGHALAIQQNEQHMMVRVQRLEQMVRKQAMLIEQLQANPGTQAGVPATPASAPVQTEPGMPAELYLEFEANFRGSKDMIRERLKANLSYFRDNATLFSEPVLDLGCGRGEWLQLLKEENIPAIGVDSNTAMIQCCTDAGLEAYVGDALHYLAALPAGSLGGLTAFHIIEHLPLDVFIKLIDEAKRVVRSGGVVLFETPNPENLIVGACNFYIDPTHRNPLPPALVAFLLKARGFERVEIDRRHPGDPALLLQGGDEGVTGPLNRLLFGAQDYAAIGYAP